MNKQQDQDQNVFLLTLAKCCFHDGGTLMKEGKARWQDQGGINCLEMAESKFSPQ